MIPGFSITEEPNPRYCAARACRCGIPRHPGHDDAWQIAPEGCAACVSEGSS